MQDTRTHARAVVVKRNPQTDAGRLERLFKSLDCKGQAYVGLWQYSDVSSDGTILYQYLMMRQGGNTHAFPTIREIKKRFRWSQGRLYDARDELLEKLPEVFEIVKGTGKSRDSYYLTPYEEWPLEVRRRLWFSCVPTTSTQSVPTVGTQGAVGELAVSTLHGNSNGDSSYGTRESEVKGEECCEKCGRRGTFQLKGHWVCDHGTECHQRLYEKYGMT